MERGIDISSHNAPGSSAVEAKMNDPSYTFVIAKATEGKGYDDSAYLKHQARSKAAGKKFGAYHFAWPSQDPLIEAEHFVRVAALQPGDVACLDLENWDSKNNYAAMAGVGWRQRLEYGLIWLRTVEEAIGAQACVYVNWSWLGNFRTVSTLDEWVELTSYPLWLASYSTKNPDGTWRQSKPGEYASVNPKEGTNLSWAVAMHQFTSNDGGLDGDALIELGLWERVGVPEKEDEVTEEQMARILSAIETLSGRVDELASAQDQDHAAIVALVNSVKSETVVAAADGVKSGLHGFAFNVTFPGE